MTNLDDRLRNAAASLEPNEAPIPPFKGVQQRARRRRMIGVTGALVVIAAVTFVIMVFIWKDASGFYGRGQQRRPHC